MVLADFKGRVVPIVSHCSRERVDSEGILLSGPNKSYLTLVIESSIIIHHNNHSLPLLSATSFKANKKPLLSSETAYSR